MFYCLSNFKVYGYPSTVYGRGAQPAAAISCGLCPADRTGRQSAAFLISCLKGTGQALLAPPHPTQGQHVAKVPLEKENS